MFTFTKTDCIISAIIVSALLLALAFAVRAILKRNIRVSILERHLRMSNHSLTGAVRHMESKIPVTAQYICPDIQAVIDSNNKILLQSASPPARHRYQPAETVAASS